MKTALLSAAFLLASALPACAQPPSGAREPEFDSPETSEAGSITFRIYAPNAEDVRLAAGDIPGVGPDREMTKNDEGVWETTIETAPAGAYRYHFVVDGLSVVDPRNPAVSETNTHVESLAYVSGSEISDVSDVPHGAVADVTYYSQTLQRPRRMHVYTPPGYERGDERYPVFYLLHGATDSDASWSTIGRAGFILDNLIAEGKAQPMIVVMPAGHTGPFRFGPGGGDFQQQMQDFQDDFANDLRPYIEKHYRVLNGRKNRAIAGLSMGGAQTLNIAFAKLDDYGYIGVYSSGIFGIAGGFGGAPPSTQWEDEHQATLDDADLKSGLRLLWFGIGKDDFLAETSDATVEMFKKHGFEPVYRQTDGGHAWYVWRDYLAEFAPLLFAEK